jgi:hypothetical protein
MTLHGRSPERVAELLAPWKVEIARPLDQWLDVESLLQKDTWHESSVTISGMLLSRSTSP